MVQNSSHCHFSVTIATNSAIPLKSDKQQSEAESNKAQTTAAENTLKHVCLQLFHVFPFPHDGLGHKLRENMRTAYAQREG